MELHAMEFLVVPHTVFPTSLIISLLPIFVTMKETTSDREFLNHKKWKISDDTSTSPALGNNHQYDLNGTKKPRPEYTPDIYATNEDPLPQPLTPIFDGTITSDPSQTENDSQERFQNDKRIQLDQQHFSNDDTQEAKKQRIPHEPDTFTITEPPSTDPLIHISVTIETMCTSTSTDPQLEPLSIPTFSQIQSQTQTIESTSNETSLDNLYQDHIDTVTRGFNPHAGPTIDLPSEPPPIPFHANMVIEDSSLTIARDQIILTQPPTPIETVTLESPPIPHIINADIDSITRPPHWHLMSGSAKRHWRQKETKNKWGGKERLSSHRPLFNS
jgi:hypothetical protein